MQGFKYIEDVDAWTAPMDYDGLWYAVAPYDLVLQPREHCDQQVAQGKADIDTVLDVLKYMVRLELTEKLNLTRKPVTPWLKLVGDH